MKRIRHLFTLASVLILSLSTQAQSGMPFQANPDNVFITPNASSYTVIDILTNDVYAFDCGLDALEVTILTNGTKGIARVRTADKKIEYRPRPNFIGADQVVYQIYCPATNKTSSATIYININDKPDAISDAECYVDPVGIKFEIKELARSAGLDVNSLSNVICGDVDGDGQVEIFVFNHPGGANTYAPPTKILAFRLDKTTNTLNEVPNYTVNLPYVFYPFPYGNYLIANVNGNQYASIFVVMQANKAEGPTEATVTRLIKYSYDPSSDAYKEEGRVVVSSNMAYGNLIPTVGDIMGDGNQQICLIDKVYDAKTLTLLANGNYIPAGNNFSSYSFGVGAHNPGQHRLGYASSLSLADIDNDGILEVIGGDCVYKVQINSYTNPSLNTFSLFKRVNKTGKTGIFDGHTAIADFDLDGQLEVAVTCKQANIQETVTDLKSYVYIYNPRTGEVLHNNTAALPDAAANGNTGPSRPFIGDLDGDGYPEIALTAIAYLGAYKYNTSSKNLDLMWKLGTTDNSGATTLSVFDFGQQGFSQLVYRDETTLRILDGRIKDENGITITDAKRTLATFDNAQSATVNEYPIVADVNGDGHAEILVTAIDDYQSGADYRGQLRVYDAAGANKWAPARTVWNQIGYNPLYVNEDLTIPANPINPATPFYSPDGTIDRPFNNFLQQSTSLNKEGTMILLGPDLTFDARLPRKITKLDATDELQVEIGVINQGDAIFTGPISLQLYAYFEATDTYVAAGAPYSYPNSAGLTNETPNNSIALSYKIPSMSTALPAGYDNLFITVNLSTPPGQVPAFSGAAECHGGWNNIGSGLSLVDGYRIMCEGATETVEANPKNTYTIKWYSQGTGGSVLNIGDSYEVTKDSALVTYYFVETYKTPSSPNPISSIRDTIFVYRAPDSLVWTGKGNTKDWHDYLNWENSNKRYKDFTNIPRPCTNVLLPSSISNYPDLDATNYTDYTEAECNNIHFDFGSEVVRPDMLQYSKAFVNVTFDSHRWYMFAPPLKDFYTGDFYRNSPIPFYDDIKNSTKFWARRNPWKFTYKADWTGLFYLPEQSFLAGQGLGVWMSDKTISGQVAPPRDPFDFAFPKQDILFKIYKEDTPNIDTQAPIYNTPRNNHHRFIFDGAVPGADFDLTIDGENKQVGQMMLVANPFMAHLDFDKFYAKNSSLIQNYYCIIDQNAVLQYYNKNASTLSKNIAPMQAFLVEVKVPFDKLKANGTMTLSSPGSKIRSLAAETDADESFSLIITATQGTESAKAFIELSKDAADQYVPGEDISSLLPAKVSSDTRSLSVYSHSADNIKTVVNRMSDKNIENRIISLGAWSPNGNKSEDITINVSNLPAIPSEYEAILYDEVTKEEYRLKYNSMHTFKNITTDADLFVEGRFSLRFTKSENNSTGIEEDKNTETDVIAFVKNNKLYLRSGQDIRQVDVYNMQGQLLLNEKPNSSVIEYNLPKQDIYIVRVNSSGKVNSYKLINQ